MRARHLQSLVAGMVYLNVMKLTRPVHVYGVVEGGLLGVGEHVLELYLWRQIIIIFVVLKFRPTLNN